jgi:transcriptional regulator with XRE-family HTH domain
MSTKQLPSYWRTYRKRNALTQRELARLLGSSYGSKVSRYERAARLPTLDTLIAYEILFKVPWRELLPGEYNRVYKQIRERAQALSRDIDAKTPWTPALQRKFDFIANIINVPPSHPS